MVYAFPEGMAHLILEHTDQLHETESHGLIVPSFASNFAELTSTNQCCFYGVFGANDDGSDIYS
jgi:hypothetical protein